MVIKQTQKFPTSQLGIVPTIRRIVKQMLGSQEVSFKVMDTHITNDQIATYSTDTILVTEVPGANQVIRVLYALVKATVTTGYNQSSTVNLFFGHNNTIYAGSQTVIATNTPGEYVAIVASYSQAQLKNILAGQGVYFGKIIGDLTGAGDVEMDVRVVYEVIDIQ